MVYQYFMLFLLTMYIICDVNYVLRTLFTVWSSRVWKPINCILTDVTTVYGICTFQDYDIWFKNIRLSRLLRELDFARYHFYDQTGICQRSRMLRIHSLQGSTFTITLSPIPLFAIYKINTKLVYWDDRSLFFEHEVVTIRDAIARALFVSRQYAIGENGEAMIKILLSGLHGSQNSPSCPLYIKHWLHSMLINSAKLKTDNVIETCKN